MFIFSKIANQVKKLKNFYFRLVLIYDKAKKKHYKAKEKWAMHPI